MKFPIINKSNNAQLWGTVDGSLVKNNFEIIVSLEMNVWCDCDTINLEVRLPIIIATEFPTLPSIEKPENWQPQII